MVVLSSVVSSVRTSDPCSVAASTVNAIAAVPIVKVVLWIWAGSAVGGHEGGVGGDGPAADGEAAAAGDGDKTGGVDEALPAPPPTPGDRLIVPAVVTEPPSTSSCPPSPPLPFTPPPLVLPPSPPCSSIDAVLPMVSAPAWTVRTPALPTVSAVGCSKKAIGIAAVAAIDRQIAGDGDVGRAADGKQASVGAVLSVLVEAKGALAFSIASSKGHGALDVGRTA